MSLTKTILIILYRLTLPGSLLLAVCFGLLRIGVLDESSSAVTRFFPIAVFAAGLVLSAVFRRSRLFFAILALALAQAALGWAVPVLPSSSGHVLTDSIAILLSLNLLDLAFSKERGIISPAGRKRLALAGLQIIAIGILCMPPVAEAVTSLQRPFVSEALSSWSQLSQPALIIFLSAAALLGGLLVQRYGAVESSLFWALIAALMAFRMNPSSRAAGVFFLTGGLGLIIALLETSYRMAYHDELTQLPSRRALNEALLKLPDSFSIAMLDIDHFKKFNDTYGHEAGDQALRLVASRLARIAGGGRAYRYGGEEFAVLFPGKPAEEVFVYLDHLRKMIEQSTFVVRGKDRRKGKRGKSRTLPVKRETPAKRETKVTVSIGVAGSNATRLTPAEVLRMADDALYRAKAKGRNRTVTAKSSEAVETVKPRMRVASVS